jgi:pentose-5-phosphate-3-epimerase
MRFIKRILGIKKLEDEVASLRSLIRNTTTIGVDVHFRSQTQIMVISRLRDGYIKRIDLHFENFLELQRVIKELKERYSTDDVVCDAPRHFRDLTKGF